MKAKVCVIIPTFNSYQVTKQTVNKLLYEQSYKNFDIIIVDAGSSDYKKLKEDFQNEKRVIILRTNKDLGGAGSFWIGMKYAYENNYDIIILSDNDAIPISYILIEELIKEIKRNPYQVIVPREVSSFLFTNNKKIKITTFPFHYFTMCKKVIDEIGLPAIEFFIWADDREYCKRISIQFPLFLLTYIQYFHRALKPLEIYCGKKNFYHFRNSILLDLRRVKIIELLWHTFSLLMHSFTYAWFVDKKSVYLKRCLKAILLAYIKGFGKIEKSDEQLVRYKLCSNTITEKEIYEKVFDIVYLDNEITKLIDLTKVKYKIKKLILLLFLLFISNDKNKPKLSIYLLKLKHHLLLPIFNINKKILTTYFDATYLLTAKEIVTYDFRNKKFLEIENKSLLAILYYFLTLWASLLLTILFLTIGTIYGIKQPYVLKLKKWFENYLLGTEIEIYKENKLLKKIKISKKDWKYLVKSLQNK